jgi:hypothetical protein
MDKLDPELIKRIEKVLDIKFELWQVNYLLDIPMVLNMRITGRGTGKTLVYTIKLLFSDEEPIRLYDLDEIAAISDWFSFTHKQEPHSDTHYSQWFRRYLSNFYEILSAAGIQTRPILYNKEGEIW